MNQKQQFVQKWELLEKERRQIPPPHFEKKCFKHMVYLRISDRKYDNWPSHKASKDCKAAMVTAE